MNIVGKMLVIFNLIFALVVGGFLIIDMATRLNWKKAYEALERELKVSRLANTTLLEKEKDLMAKLDDASKSLVRSDEKLLVDLDVERAKIVQFKIDIQVEQEKAKTADGQRQELLGNNNRLTQENKDLHELIKKKDEVIIGMENDIKNYRQEAFYHLGIAKSMQTRNETLLKQNRDLIKQLAQKDATPLATALSKDPNQPNPPPAFVKGEIENINFKEGNPTLAQISIGSDHGLSAGHTLDVYRLTPKAMYLGTMRLVDVYAKKAVGQMVEAGFSPTRPRIQIGDQVASEIGVAQK